MSVKSIPMRARGTLCVIGLVAALAGGSARVRADDEDILHVYQYADKGVVVDEPTAGPELLFHPSGRSASPTTIRVRDSQGRETTFTVSITGRVSVS